MSKTTQQFKSIRGNNDLLFSQIISLDCSKGRRTKVPKRNRKGLCLNLVKYFDNKSFLQREGLKLANGTLTHPSLLTYIQTVYRMIILFMKKNNASKLKD